MNKDQKKAFDSIIAMKGTIQNLANFVQNDFDQLLAEGLITKQEMKESILNIDRDFKQAILELNSLKNRVISIVDRYSKAL